MKMKKQAKYYKKIIKKHYACHNVDVKLHECGVIKGSKRFFFRVQLMPGTREDMVFNRASDIRAALEVPLLQPFRDGNSICLAVSEQPVTENSLMKMLNSPDFIEHTDQYRLALGYDLMGHMVFDDLEKMPHAMYAGATNSGKSIGLTCLVLSLVSTHPVDEVNMVIFDIGANSMELFTDIPHLSCPIVKDVETGIQIVAALLTEMERRIALSEEELTKLPRIVCVMDEFISFLESIQGKMQQETINNISAILRRGRKAKMNMVLATQDATKKTMKVDIGNITSKMVFHCNGYHTSVAILGRAGAEKLPGKGAMLYQSQEHFDPQYIQGAFISPEEAMCLINRIQIACSDYNFDNKFVIPEQLTSEYLAVSDDTGEVIQIKRKDRKELADITMWVLGQHTISAEQIKSEFPMGNRVKEIMNDLCEMGIITEKFSNQPRTVIPLSIEDISENVIAFLEQYDYFREDINSLLESKNCAAECNDYVSKKRPYWWRDQSEYNRM